MRPIRTAPAVWELEGPTMMGPSISKISIITGSFRGSLFRETVYHALFKKTSPFFAGKMGLDRRVGQGYTLTVKYFDFQIILFCKETIP